MRKSLLLFIATILTTVVVYSQADECATLGGSTMVGDTDMISDDLTTYGDQMDYVTSNATLLGSGFVTGFSFIEWDGPDGYYSINAVSGASTVWSVSLAENCADFAAAGNEIFNGTIADGTGTNMPCFYMQNGTEYYLGYAVGAGAQTTIQFTFNDTDNTEPNNVCSGAIALNMGDPINTNCIAVPDVGSFANTCPTNMIDLDDDNSIIGSCPGLPYASEETVWYTFTVASDCTLQLDYSNTAGTMPNMGLFSGSCGSLNLESCDMTGSITGVSLAQGTVYYMAVAAQANVVMAMPDLSFSFTASVTVPNDDCNTQAEGLTLGDPAVDGTTACATASEIAFCTDINTSSSPAVYYTFTTPAGESTYLNVTMTGNTNTTGVEASNLAIELLSACGTSAGLSTSQGDACDPLAGVVRFDCLLPGTTYFIAVASSEAATAGDFDIAIEADASITIPANNQCVNAVDMGTLLEGCMTNTHTGTHLDACPSPEVPTTGCGTISANPTVWATFTTDANTDEIQINYTGDTQASPEFALLSGDCAGGFMPVGACQSDGTEIFGVMPSTTYYVAMSPENTQPGEGYTLEILALPSNDDCADAIPLDSTNPSASGTTLCATSTEMAYCSQVMADMGHVVYYTYTTTQMDADQTVNLLFDITAGGGVSGTDATDIEIGLFGTCGGAELPYGHTGDACNALDGQVVYQCIPGNSTVIIAVGSPDLMAGDFEITVTEEDDATSTDVPNNDDCANAETVTTLACATVTVSGTNVNACPENIMGISCDYMTDPVVWYSVELPADAIGLEFTMLTGDGVHVTLFSESTCLPTNPAGTACFVDDMNITGLTGGNTYLMGVGSDVGSETAFEFEVLAVVPPANDLCANAETINSGDNLPGTTACATEDTAICGLGANSDSDHVVWYTYTNGTTNTQEVAITLTGDDPSFDGSFVQVFTGADCAGATEINPYDPADTSVEIDECTVTTGTTLNYECIAPGDILFIAVASPDGTEGSFMIELTEQNPAPLYDICDNAEPITVNTDCSIVNVTGTNEFACPEASALGVTCGFETQPTVWMSVTMPAGAVGLEMTNLSGDFSATYFSGGCAALAADGACFTGSGNSALTYMENDVILIAITSTEANEGNFSFDLLAVIPPANDLCATAEAITGTAEDAPITTTGTTACATGDANVCSTNATTDHVVWYTYELNTGNTNNTDIEITINAGTSGATPIQNDVDLAIYNDCAYAVIPDAPAAADICALGIGETLTLECIDPAETPTITIAIASVEGNEGEFDIVVTETNYAPDNDTCDGITAESVNDDCTPALVSTSTVNACPETDNLGTSCALGTDNVVWHMVEIPAGGIGIELSNLPTTANAAFFSGTCAGLILDGDCFPGVGPGLAGTSNLTYIPGNQVWIAISTTDADAADFNFEITAVVPPANNLCADAEVVTGGGEGTAVTTAGTTDCASEDVDICGLNGNTTNDHIVWYQYTNNTGGNIDLLVQLTSTDGDFDGDLQVFDGDDCASLVTLDPTTPGASCGQPLATDLIFECLAAGEVIYIAVASPDGSEGSFDLVLTEQNFAPDNDECGMADTSQADVTACEVNDMTANDTNACPEDIAGFSCDLQNESIVWMSINMPVDGNAFEFSNLSANAFIVVFNNDCTALAAQGTIAGGADCVTGDMTVEGLTGNTTYLFAVGQSGATEGPITFDLTPLITPSNDLCDDPTYMAEDISTTAAAGVNGTNACATPHPTAYCGLSTMTSHTVYYSYTTQSTTNATVTIALDGQGTGADMTDGVIQVWTDCTFAEAFMDPTNVNAPCDAFNTDVVYECVPPNTTIVIAVSSADTEDGNFTITITEDNAGVPSNDACTAPETISFTDPDDACIWIDNITANSVDACPESFDLASDCGFDEFPIVWYSFTAMTGASSVEFDMISATTGAPIFALFDLGADCDNLNNIVSTDGTANCVTGTGMSGPFPIVAGNEYLIGIGTNNMNGGEVEFTIKQNVAPPNDMPCDAQVLDPMTSTAGTTSCATQDFSDPDCDAVDAENSVWYTYTLQPGETGVEITIPVIGTDVGPITVMAVDGCNPTPTIIDNDNGTTCDAASLTEPLVLSCLDPEQQVWIMVSTSDDNSGEFEIQVDPIVPDPACIDNDLCDNAQDEGEIVTDADCTVISDCNTNACAEEIGDCGEVNNVVWYSVSNDGMGEFINVTVENAEFETPIIAVFTGSCAALTQLGNCETGSGNTANTGPIEINPGGTPTAGEQYWIAVGSQEAVGGTFDLCIEITAGCPNDDPCNGVELDANVAVDNPASTINCNEDTPNPDCTFTEPSTVWYTFEVPVGFGAFEIIITNINVPGDFGVQAGPYSDAACDNLPAADVSACGPDVLTKPVLVPCTPEGGTFYIQVMTEGDTEEGDFTIEINPLVPEESMPVAPVNDICSQAEEFVITPDTYCSYITLEGTTVDACAELFNVTGGCNFAEWPTVWYTFTMPNDPNLTQVDVLIESLAGLGNPVAAVMEATCGDVNSINVVSPCIMTDGTTAEENNIEVVPGNTYYIAVSGADGQPGVFEANIKIDAPPVNDSPCPTAMNPPVDLSGGGSHDGTTCCANGFNDDPNSDYQNQECAGNTDDDAVWYFYDPSDGIDGFDINVTGAGIQGNTAIELYSTNDPNAGCTGALTIEDSSCGQLPAEMSTAICDPALVYYIKVASSEANCGQFNITIEEVTSNCAADECVDAEILTPETPNSCDDGDIRNDLETCLEYACPETAQTNCQHGDGPTVWFQVDIASLDATQLVTTVDAPGFEAVWSIYRGTSCDDLDPVPMQSVVDGVTQTYNCSDEIGGEGNNFVTPVAENPDTPGTNFSYWIAVTAIGDIEDPNFTLTYFSSLGCLACTGDTGFDCDNGEFTATVDGETWDPDGDGIDGPFCPGQEVEVCWEFNYDTTGSGNDWLHGMIPSFGSGWDLESIDFASENIGGSWQWYEQDDANCPPVLGIYNLPNVCTYEEDGILKICNTNCNNCPCEGPLLADAPLPGAWFWNSSACGGPGCPIDEYGIPSGTNVDVNVCLTLRVKTFDSAEECEMNKDLNVFIQTTSDAVTGCWGPNETSPCILDPTVSSVGWEIDCDIPARVFGPEQTICSGDMLDIQLEVEDGDVVDIVVAPIDNPNVDGESLNPNGDITFPAGDNPVITDVLVNNSDVLQEVLYEVYSVDPSKPCPGVKDTVYAYVHPAIQIEFPPQEVCAGFATTLDVLEQGVTTGGSGNYVQFAWEPEFSTESSITVMPPVTTQYCVTVTDDADCTGSTCVEVFVGSLIEVELVPSLDIACQDGVEDFNLIVDANITSGSPPYTFDWDVPSGLDYNENSSSTETQLVFNEENSDTGTFTLGLTIFDAQGCEETVEVDINIGAQPELELTPGAIPCAGSGDDHEIAIITYSPQSGVDMDRLEFYDCSNPAGDVLIFEVGVSVNYTLTYDPEDYPCVRIVTIDQNGCSNSEEYNLNLTEGLEPNLMASSHCIGDSSAVSVTNAADFVSFEWSTGATTPTIMANNTEAAFYQVTVTDANSCTAEAQIEVTVNSIPTVSISGSTSYCGTSGTTLTADGAATYQWYDSSDTPLVNTAAISITSPGTYYVEGQNAEGCADRDTVEVSQADNLTIVISDAVICDSGMSTMSAGENPNYSYNWEESANPGVQYATTAEISVSAGEYCVTVTDNVEGCTGAACNTVVVNTTPVVQVTDSITVCNENIGIGQTTVTFADQIITTTGGSWVALQTQPDITTDPVDFAGLPLGEYIFEYRSNTAEDPCMDVVDSMVVTVINCECPSVALLDPVTLCNEGTTTYDLEDLKNNNNMGTWSPSGSNPLTITGTTVDVADVAAGEYFFTWTLDNPVGGDCPPSNMTSIIVVEAPTGGSMLVSVCNAPVGGESTQIDLTTALTAGTPTTGDWFNADGTPLASPVVDMNGMAANTQVMYTYVVSGTEPCDALTIPVTLLVVDCACPQFLLNDPDPLCNSGDMINLDDFNTTTESGSWAYVSGGINPVTLTNGNILDATGLNSGLYQFSWTLDSPVAGCVDSDTLNVIVSNQPVVETISAGNVCNNDIGVAPTNIDLFDLISGTNIGQWFDEDGNQIDAEIEYLNTMGDTTYTYTFITTSAQIPPCQNDTTQVMVTVNNCECPNVDINPPGDLCNNQVLDLNSLKTPFTADGTWDMVGQSIVTITDGMVDLSTLVAGEYTITYTLDPVPQGDCQQDSVVTFNLSVFNEATVTNAVSVCVMESQFGPTVINFEALVTDGNMEGQWQNTDSAPVNTDNWASVDFTGAPANTTYTFTYVVDNDDPCPDEMYPVLVTTNPCDCPLITPLAPGVHCNNVGNLDLSAYNDPQYPNGAWSSTELTITNNMLDLTGLAAGDYNLNFTATGIPTECDSVVARVITIQEFLSAELDLDHIVCVSTESGNEVTLDFTSFFMSGEQGGTWEDTDNSGVDLSDLTSVSFEGLPENVTYNFTYTIDNEEPCEDDVHVVMIMTNPCDCPIINPDNAGLHCNAEMTVDLTQYNDSEQSGTWSSTQVSVTNNVADISGMMAGTYTLVYTIDNPMDGCPDNVERTIEIVEQQEAVVTQAVSLCAIADQDPNVLNFNEQVLSGNMSGTWADTDGSGVDLSDLNNVSFVGLGLNPGDQFTFTYTVDNADPCTDPSYEMEVTILDCDCPVIIPGNPGTHCTSEGELDLTQYNDEDDPGTWSSTQVTITGSVIDLTGLVPGDYTLTYTIDNPEPDCPPSADVTLVVVAPLSAGTALDPLSFCMTSESEVVDLFAQLVDEDQGGTWTETSTTPSSSGFNAAGGTFDIANVAVGAYTFTYSHDNDEPCADDQATITININEIPVADAGMDQTITCLAGQMSANLGGDSSSADNITYLWSHDGGASIDNPTLSQIEVTQAGTYTLLVTNTETSCFATDEVVVSLSDDIPSVELVATDISCNGAQDGTIELVNPMGGNGDYSYSFNGGAFSTQTTYTGLSAGTYTVVVQDSSGSGCTSESSATISEPALLTLDLGQIQSVTIGDTVTYSIADQLEGFDVNNIVWTVNGEEICTGVECTSVVIVAADNVNVNVVVTYNNACTAEAATQIQVTRVFEVTLPNVISADDNGNNDVFYVNSDNVETVLSMLIYDRWGELVFASSNHPPSDDSYGWNGKFKGKAVNPGVFVYVVEVLYKGGNTETLSGDVTVVR